MPLRQRRREAGPADSPPPEASRRKARSAASDSTAPASAGTAMSKARITISNPRIARPCRFG